MSKNMINNCRCVLGPYKGYMGVASYDPDAGIFHGEVVGTNDVITFQARHVEELGDAFAGSVDDYLDFCKESGEKPEKPFSGRFVVRIPSELHRSVSLLAQAEHKSLNALLEECLQEKVQAAFDESRGENSEQSHAPPKPRKRRKQEA